MSQTFKFYDERAKQAQDAADEAGLARVRERELRSAEAWRALANRAKKIDEDRVLASEAKAERLEQEQADADAARMAEPVQSTPTAWN